MQTRATDLFAVHIMQLHIFAYRIQHYLQIDERFVKPSDESGPASVLHQRHYRDGILVLSRCTLSADPWRRRARRLAP